MSSRMGMVRILALFFVGAIQLFPCSCSTPRVCGNVVRSAAAFTALTISGGDGWTSPSVRFKVRRAIKGVRPGTTVEVDTASQSSSSCAATFKIGQEYLVFATNSNGRLLTTACSGSRPLAQAQQELEYLSAWERGATISEIVGYVLPDIRGSKEKWRRAYDAMSGAVVRVIGPDGKTSETRAHEKGDFALRVASAGRYDVAVSVTNWISKEGSDRVVVPEKGCGETAFHMRPDGQVAGRAVQADGLPAEAVLLKLVPLQEFRETMTTTTDHSGNFQFRGVLAGNYKLGVNPDNMDDPSPKVPFAPTFYPGVGEKNSSRVIRVNEFGTVELKNAFRLPRVLNQRIIGVRVTLEDGQPVRGASVSCTPEEHSYWRKDATDAQGVISFAAMD